MNITIYFIRFQYSVFKLYCITFSSKFYSESKDKNLFPCFSLYHLKIHSKTYCSTFSFEVFIVNQH